MELCRAPACTVTAAAAANGADAGVTVAGAGMEMVDGSMDPGHELCASTEHLTTKQRQRVMGTARDVVSLIHGCLLLDVLWCNMLVDIKGNDKQCLAVGS